MISAIANGTLLNAAVKNSANQTAGQIQTPELPAPSVPSIDVNVYHGDRILDDISRNTKSEVLSKLDNYSRQINSKVEFDYDETNNQMIVMSRDRNGRVTKQYPAEGLINLRARAREYIGKLLTESV